MKSADKGSGANLENLPIKASARNELRKRSFNRIVELYHDARPTYPEATIEDTIRLSGLPDDGRILEIGPGTGQATLPFARRGYSMLCLELGDQLAQFLRRRCRRYPKVRIENTAFEAWPPEPGAFDLVLAATSFHWIPVKVGYPKAADVLKPGGSLALYWNFRETPDTDLFHELSAIYRRYAPKLTPSKPPEERIRKQREKIIGSGRFEPPDIGRYPWQSDHTADEYVALLRTQSNHHILEEPVRERLLGAIHDLIERHGGRLTQPVIAARFLARKR